MKFSAIAFLIASSGGHLIFQEKNQYDEIENSYLQHIAKYGKSYGTEEEYKFRLEIYKQKVEFIREHNSKVEEGEALVGENHMMDWTEREYKKVLGYKPRIGSEKSYEIYGPISDAPASVDWRKKGAVTPVKNQGQCGSCWSFSATGSMEGRYQIAGNKLTSFSEQQLVDCSKAEGNQGCQGGLMDDAFKYATTHKMETEADYAYHATEGKCNYDASKGVVEVKSFKDVTPTDPNALLAAVAEGPVSVAIDASGFVFQLYNGGIIKRFCGTKLDHGVLIVGYGSSQGTDYWLLKNSWGASWGEEGYFRIRRDMSKKDKGVCGVQMDPSYPIF